MKYDVLVLGAGIIGVSSALHLQERGWNVALIDKAVPGEGTSYGNAGLIERASLIPYAFPRDLPSLARYALNLAPEAHYHPLFLPRIAPWLWRYWRNSAPRRLRQIADEMRPLIEASIVEHEVLMKQAGILPALRRSGWIKAFRSSAKFEAAVREAESLKAYNLSFDVLDPSQLQEREPYLHPVFTGAIHWRDPATLADPGALVKAYAGLFEQRGGTILVADATHLHRDGHDWRIGDISGREAVLALGPWSDMVFGRLGYAIPLAVKRGYHLHYRAQGEASLTHPVLDAQGGYVLAPMTKGLRLTTGVEFAPRNAPPTPVQIARTAPYAKSAFPLGDAIETQPWMGCRPSLPDMKPVIGPARHKGLWFAFGHNHHGLTLGPATGKLLAQMMSGENPFTDPAPYSAMRFERS